MDEVNIPRRAKVLVVGSGGREHAIVDALSRSPRVEKIYCAPGNAGIARQAKCVPLADTQVDELADFAAQEGIDLTVVGPEVSLAAGIVDEFEARGLKIFGPSKAAARIESSKDFAKSLMAKYNVPTAAYRTFSDYNEALVYVNAGKLPVVLKYDGLAAGKGVVVAETYEQADEALKDMLLDDKTVYVMASNDKPIKYVTYGDGIILQKDPMQNADLTYEWLYTERTGVGMIINEVFGKYTFAN